MHWEWKPYRRPWFFFSSLGSYVQNNIIILSSGVNSETKLTSNITLHKLWHRFCHNKYVIGRMESSTRRNYRRRKLQRFEFWFGPADKPNIFSSIWKKKQITFDSHWTRLKTTFSHYETAFYCSRALCYHEWTNLHRPLRSDFLYPFIGTDINICWSSLMPLSLTT